LDKLYTELADSNIQVTTAAVPLPEDEKTEMSDEWINTISKRYIELYEKVIGQPFKPEQLTQEETVARVVKALEQKIA
jgi:hypothetical protein